MILFVHQGLSSTIVTVILFASVIQTGKAMTLKVPS